MRYETVIGLEVHIELLTETKIFCSCPTEFGGEPNTHVCPVCLGLPGTLPTLNKKAVELSVRAGLAAGCEITRISRFDRKNYFYPDLPKAYQISQLYLPLCRNGSVTLDSGKIIRIKEMHMEEDAGKLMHSPDDNRTLIDCNRCGAPLLEKRRGGGRISRKAARADALCRRFGLSYAGGLAESGYKSLRPPGG